jgi:two-component system, NtrC family, sensor kinase
MLNYFINIPTEYFIYFLYGSAFLFLSFGIFIKDMKGSDLRLADSLWLLGMFGLTHGLHELLAMYPLIEGAHLSMQELFNARLISLVVLVLSFLFLLQFGWVLTFSARNKRPLWFNGMPAVLVLAWVAFITVHDPTMTMRYLRQVETSARLLFCLTGALLTAYGLMTYSHEIKVLSRSVSRHLWYAGVAFIFYGIFAGVFVTRFSIIPLPFPIELLRGLTAIVITLFIIKALNVFNIEMRKRIEQQTRHLVQTEKLTSLGQLAAGIAHEINNPLTNASLGIQTLKLKFAASGSGSDIIEKLDAVERNIDKASVIARELLQFSRQRESEFWLVNMNSIVWGALTLLQYKLKNILVRQDLADVPDMLGDAGKLEQVIINVLSNAVEAMPQGGTISIATSRAKAGVRIRIVDTGPGIPEENLTRVFDPFFTTKEPGSGTGLGLSICYGIIKDHHGTIEVSRMKEKGTMVTITIPERKQYEAHSGC